MSTPASELMDTDLGERAAQTTHKSPTRCVEDDQACRDVKSESSSVLYEPLSESRLEIRIIDLEPSTDYHSEIHCKLRKFSLQEAAYANSSLSCLEVLSYTWGNDAARANVVVNGQRIQITNNLEAFLRRRRETQEKVTLWVDAICINQNDPQDKNNQIPKMNMIYGCASRLTIWLGPARDDSSLAIETLINLGSAAPYSKMPHLELNELTALQKLLSRPWWTRAWIVQELVIGGMGPKLRNIEVQCGDDSVLWINVVVAAARIKAYHEDLRQKFPNVENILELDSLREMAHEHLINPVTPKIIFDLLCRYRHFSATDPRDKLYAFCNMFCRAPSERVATRYDADVKDIYIRFAVDKLLAEHDLEILRYCGPSTHGLPSWVPDWSVPLGVQPLPLRRLQRFFQVPWWANPIRRGSQGYIANHGAADGSDVQYHLGPYTRNPCEIERRRQLDLKQLEITAKGYGIVQDLQEIPPDFTFHTAPDTIKDQIRKLMEQGKIIFAVQDERCLPPESDLFEIDQPDAITQGEIITERRMKMQILQELTDLGANGQYRAAQGTRADFRIDEHESTLRAKGILWETIDICHEGFVEDLYSDWKNATRFMVAVGACKAIALAHKSAAERYPTLLERLTVFWSTLFAAQVAESDSIDEQDSVQRLRYTEWLPEIPPDWVATTPPMTATTTGLVDVAECGKALEDLANSFQFETDKDGGQFRKSSLSAISEKISDPEQWPEAEREHHRADLRELGDMWRQQRYDLYHRPFEFLYIVPDPYWEIRKDCDKIAYQQTRQFRSVGIISLPASDSSEPKTEAPATRDDLRRLSSALHERLTSKPSMMPQGCVDRGTERYALGRKFFVTKNGYFGLGPKDTTHGDRVAVFFGSNVPFVLRKHGPGTKHRGWQLIGETYVHGVMEGELVRQWGLGLVESVDIVLH